MDARTHEQKVVEYLEELKKGAISSHPSKYISKLRSYYLGAADPKYADNKDLKKTKYYNVIKPIVDTITTHILDAHITTSVRPKIKSNQDVETLKTVRLMSGVINDALNNIKSVNKFESLKQKLVRKALTEKIAIAKVYWDQSEQDNLGEVKITSVDPNNFFPEPGAKSIETSNYIFVRRSESVFELKKKYRNDPNTLRKIDEILQKNRDSQEIKGKRDIDRENAEGIRTVTNDQTTTQVYVGGSDHTGIISGTKNIVLWECYTKDDTIWAPEKEDTQDEQALKKTESLKFPNGRVIIYTGEHILEDKPIEYPFGFPFVRLILKDIDEFMGNAIAEDLVAIDDRINMAYHKRRYLIGSHENRTFVDPTSGVTKRSFKTDLNIIEVDPGGLEDGRFPRDFNSGSIQDIAVVNELIDKLKEEAKEISRVNDMMISGERPHGVTSGNMVNDLNESPMSSIRDMQRSFKDFLVEISQKAIVIMQLYYNQSRLLRLSSGDRYAKIPMREEGVEPVTEIIEEVKNEEGGYIYNVVDRITGDLSVGEYEVEVTAGTAQPRSREAAGRLTAQLVKEGAFDMPDVDLLDHLLESLDYPNRSAIIEKVRENREKMAEDSQINSFDEFLSKGVSVGLDDILELVDYIPDTRTKLKIANTILSGIGLLQPGELAGIADVVDDESQVPAEPPSFVEPIANAA